MPSHHHAVVTEMFLARPALATELLTDVLGQPLPAHRSARAVPADATVLRTTEHHADAVILLDDDVGHAAAVVVEIQLRPDEDKRWTWPLYLASVRLRWRCPTVLLVLCPDEVTARWARSPISLGHVGFELRPAVLGPDALRTPSDPARSPELTVLSVLAHPDEGPLTRLDVLADALASVRPDLAIEYALLVLAALPERAAAHLEELMSAQTHPYQSEFTRRLRDEGRVEGRVEERIAVILQILARRGVEVDERARARISSCADLDLLGNWIDRAIVVSTTQELFAG